MLPYKACLYVFIKVFFFLMTPPPPPPTHIIFFFFNFMFSLRFTTPEFFLNFFFTFNNPPLLFFCHLVFQMIIPSVMSTAVRLSLVLV